MSAISRIELSAGVWISIMGEAQGVSHLEADHSEILWLVCLSGEAHLRPSFAETHSIMHQGNSSLLAFPRAPWKVTVIAQGSTRVSVARITLDALHALIAADYSQGSNSASFDMRAMSRPVQLSPLQLTRLSQLFVQQEQSRFNILKMRGEFYSLFAEMLEKVFGSQMDQCPFQIDLDTEQKIRLAESLIIKKLDETPSISALAIEVELPPDVLKEGFRYIFNEDIQSYFQNHKMEHAQAMLASGRYLIKEIAFEIGYRNPSHFIDAYKKKYGITPKQWQMQQNPKPQIEDPTPTEASAGSPNSSTI